MAVIRRRVGELLPSARIFLDVDDLEDISKLELYIERSMTVLIFLSRGYFLSANCLREAHASVQKAKPLVRLHEMEPSTIFHRPPTDLSRPSTDLPQVLVHERDVSKGGAPLAALASECPDELRPPIFESGRQIVPWLRLGHFQKESLCSIACGLLLASPAYRKQLLDGTGLSVFMPGAITEHNWVLPAPVVLYASQVTFMAFPWPSHGLPMTFS